MRGFSETYRIKHSDTGKRLYTILRGMKARCSNQKCKDYGNYGARGIRVCKEWEDYRVFKEWALSHGYEDGLSIERIDVNGDYCPENCKWIPAIDQPLNTRVNYHVMYHGRDYVFGELIRKKGLKYSATYNRINVYGWSVEKAIDFNPVYAGEKYKSGPKIF